MRAPEFHRLLLRKFKGHGVIVEADGISVAGVLQTIDYSSRCLGPVGNVILTVGDCLVLIAGRRIYVIKRMAE